MPPRPKTVDRESRFDLPELFFSTTDQSGRIRTGNAVFQRVAKYPLQEMIGKAHSLVRHPDMPRCVFQLLWDTLREGRPIAAYVKNMASDGSFYWVLATVVPIPGSDGYLSVRMKPSTEVFPVVEKAYSALLEIERSHEAQGNRAEGMEASLAELPRILQGLGFDTYDDFQHAVLPLEIASRDRGIERLGSARADNGLQQKAGSALFAEALARCEEIGELLDGQFRKLDSFVASSQKLDQKAVFVSNLAWDVRLVSLNAMAGAGRLGSAAAGLGVISNWIGTLAEESGTLAAKVARDNTSAARALRRSAFHVGLARLQMEMIHDFLAELLHQDEAGVREEDVRVAEEGLGSLIDCLAASVSSLFDGYDSVLNSLHPLNDHISGLRRLVRMLEITHVTGKVEACQVGGAQVFEEFFRKVGDQVVSAQIELRNFHTAVTETVADITEIACVRDRIEAAIRELSRAGRAAREAAEGSATILSSAVVEEPELCGAAG